MPKTSALRKGLISLSTFAALAAAAGGAHAAVILNAGAGDLCGANGCFQTSRIFEQTFTASGLTSPQSIVGLSVAKSLLGDMKDYAVKISFQLADGTVVADWGAYSVAALGGDVVTIAGHEIAWDPSRGDLVLKMALVIPDKGGAGGGGLLGGGGGGEGGSGGGGGLGGLAVPIAVDRSTTDALAHSLTGQAADGSGMSFPFVAVPEPSSWALMLCGFLGAGTIVRRRRAAPAKSW